MSGPRKGRKPAQRRSPGEARPYWDADRQRYRAAVLIQQGDGTTRKIRVSDVDFGVCQAKLDELRQQAADGATDRKRPTVAALAEQWCALAESTKRGEVSSRATQLPRVRKHIIDDRLGQRRADEVTVDDVEAWLERKIIDGYRAGGRRCEYSARYLHDLRWDLRAIYKWAVKRRRVRFNPVVDAELVAVAVNRKRSLSELQAGRLLTVAVSSRRRYSAYMLACLLLGARPGEIAGLSWDAIDFEAGTIDIRQAVKRGKGGVAVGLGPPKGGATRTLAASPLLLDALRRERTEQARMRLAAGPAWSTRWDGLVFLTRTGLPPVRRSLLRSLRTICTDAGIEDAETWTVYELRHSCASLLDAAGVPVHAIVDQLGHADDRMFYRHYRHKIHPTVTAATGVLDKLADA